MFFLLQNQTSKERTTSRKRMKYSMFNYTHAQIIPKSYMNPLWLVFVVGVICQVDRDAVRYITYRTKDSADAAIVAGLDPTFGITVNSKTVLTFSPFSLSHLGFQNSCFDIECLEFWLKFWRWWWWSLKLNAIDEYSAY